MPQLMKVAGDKLFVADAGLGTVGEYTTAGQVVNASLISGLPLPVNLAIIPEPSTWALLAMGAGALLLGRRRR